MQIDVKALGFSVTDSLDSYVRDRLQRSQLRGRSESIRRVTVRLSDINGPRGGRDKCCQIHVELMNGSDVVVRDVKPQLYEAIDVASARCKRTLNRVMGKRKTRRRLNLRIPTLAPAA